MFTGNLHSWRWILVSPVFGQSCSLAPGLSLQQDGRTRLQCQRDSYSLNSRPQCDLLPSVFAVDATEVHWCLPEVLKTMFHYFVLIYEAHRLWFDFLVVVCSAVGWTLSLVCWWRWMDNAEVAVLCLRATALGDRRMCTSIDANKRNNWCKSFVRLWNNTGVTSQIFWINIYRQNLLSQTSTKSAVPEMLPCRLHHADNDSTTSQSHTAK